MYLGGVTLSQSNAYRAFTKEYDLSPEVEKDARERWLGGNTYISKATVWDIFQFEPGMSWFDQEITTLYEESFEEHDRKNSEYFLRWIQEHIPEGMTAEEVDRWIEEYRVNDPK